ncbi:MAG TPA: S9 family peptidase [Candidatus Acidoferrales bacterium]|nr:S9 family peptidase [Candidatus Acidoferrales bacterium]
MNRRTAIAWACALGLGMACGSARAQEKRPMTFEDMAAMGRISEQKISPDGRWVVYTVATPSLPANRMARNLWLVPVAGGEARQLTRSGRDQRPEWSPDGKQIAFVSSREGSPAVYVLAMDGGEPVRVAHPADGADNLLWSPDGKTLAFTSNVFPDCRTEACTAERLEKMEQSKVKAMLYDHLLYRHWTEWDDGTRSHLFVVPAAGGTPRDLTPGADYNIPPFSLGGPDDIAFSPDGRELCFTAKTDAHPEANTNGDLFVVPVDGSAEPRRITANQGFDGGPVYSPNGKWIAYHAQLIAGYESDRWRLLLYDRERGTHTNLTENFDRSVDAIAWTPDSKALYFDAEDRQDVALFRMEAAAGSMPEPVVRRADASEFGLTRDGKTLVFTESSLTGPAEIFAATAEGKDIRQITHQNTALVSQLDLRPAEHFTFKASDGQEIYGMLIRPPGFDAAKKYPLVMLAHGGPQTMWTDGWGYRWNAQMFAAPGYVVLMINRRGSTGFGQKFTDEIHDDWGGKAYTDLLEGTDYATGKYPFIDKTRMVAGGGSYGGFMMDWFATHAQDRYKALWSHAGVYDQTSMYATEELWFPNHEFRGTPWTNPESYAKWSPSTSAAELGKFKTPTLVIAGEQDFRVPYTQSLEFFSALQSQGVPSKLLIFPDEGHWVLKPQNSQYWYKVVLGWIAEYVK